MVSNNFFRMDGLSFLSERWFIYKSLNFLSLSPTHLCIGLDLLGASTLPSGGDLTVSLT